MITLKDLVRSDRAIAAITGEELRLISALLEAAASSWLFRKTLPKELRSPLPMRMLASTLNRTPKEREPDDIRIAIFREMQKDKE